MHWLLANAEVVIEGGLLPDGKGPRRSERDYLQAMPEFRLPAAPEAQVPVIKVKAITIAVIQSCWKPASGKLMSTPIWPVSQRKPVFTNG